MRPSEGGGGDHSTGWPTVAREVADGELPTSVTGSRLEWSNPWFDGGVAPASPTTRQRTGATDHQAPGGAGSPPATGAARGTPTPGGFTMRPRALRVGPPIQRQALEPGATAPAPTTAHIPPAGASEEPVAARVAARGPATTQLAPVERLDETAAAVAADGAGPPADAASGGGGTAGAPGGPSAEKDLDDLARRLYDRIGLRLRRELLVERERSGALVDRGF